MIQGKSHDTCTTCGGKIIESVNDGHFGGGECRHCEYWRYISQTGILAALRRQYVQENLAQGLALDEAERVAKNLTWAAMERAINDPFRPPNMNGGTAPGIDELTSLALDVFWTAVAQCFPTSRQGNLAPPTAVRLAEAAEAAIEEWVQTNVPPHPDHGRTA